MGAGQLRDRALALLRAVDPERTLDPEAREELRREGREANLARARTWGPVVAFSEALSGWFYSRISTATVPEALWRRDLVRVHAALAVWVLLALACVYANRGLATRVNRYLGEVYYVSALCAYAIVGVNAQRVHGSLGVYLAIVVSAPYMMRASMRWYVAAISLSAVLLGAGVSLVQSSSAMRQNWFFVVAAFTLFGIGIARMHAAALVKDLSNRRALRKLNAELETRVASQVGEIVARAREIERLNERLDAQVRDRSRELSKALEQLARGVAPVSQIRPGDLLADRVEVRAMLGYGAMGVVFRGHDRVLGHEVAVKVVQAVTVHQLDALHRFLREAELLATVRHPAIVRSLHVDVSDDGRLYQVLELVDGVNFERAFAAGVRFGAREAAAVGAVAARALAASHEKGIVHRDVKPSNFMLTSADPHVKLLDFGISKVREADRADTKLTREGDLLGTPAYMSPEQIMTPGWVAGPSDVYSLGLVLYLAVAGRGPFDAETAGALLNSQVARQPIALRQRVPTLDDEFSEHIMRCLAKAAAARPTAEELARALEACAERLGGTHLALVVDPWITAARAAPVDEIVRERGRGPSTPPPSQPARPQRETVRPLA